MIKLFNKNLRQRRGITILEVIVYFTIFSLAMSAIMVFVVKSYQTLRFGNELNDAIRSAQKGVSVMIKEIREAKNADNGAYALFFAGDQEFTFFSDIDQDNNIERVRYFLDGNDLKKGVINPTGSPAQYLIGSEAVAVISEFVQNGADPIFYYYNGDWPADIINNPLPTPSRLTDTKMMRVYLKINVNPATSPGDFELESYSQIRNLKTNL